MNVIIDKKSNKDYLVNAMENERITPQMICKTMCSKNDKLLRWFDEHNIRQYDSGIFYERIIAGGFLLAKELNKERIYKVYELYEQYNDDMNYVYNKNVDRLLELYIKNKKVEEQQYIEDLKLTNE